MKNETNDIIIVEKVQKIKKEKRNKKIFKRK